MRHAGGAHGPSLLDGGVIVANARVLLAARDAARVGLAKSDLLHWFVRVQARLLPVKRPARWVEGNLEHLEHFCLIEVLGPIALCSFSRA
jgi:hypothetical protein